MMRRRETAARMGASLAAVAGVTLVCGRLLPVNATTAGFVYLLAILAAASAWGLAEGAAASILAVLCFNYFFLPPVGTFTVADPQNWIALVTFLATAIVASQLSGRARERTVEAIASQREMERLYALSRAILLVETGAQAPGEIARQVAGIFSMEGAALYVRSSGQTHAAGTIDAGGLEAKLKDACLLGTSWTEGGVTVSPIRLGGASIGSLAARGAELTDAAMQSICNLAAIGLERVQAMEAATRAEIARRSDELKSTLLDAIAHEFKTPLTAIRAAATALVSQPEAAAEARLDLLRVVDEESKRLSRLVTEAIQMARIETGKIRLNRAPLSAAELIRRVVQSVEDRAEGRIEVKAPEGLDWMEADAEMMEMALRQVVDNALKYSPAKEKVKIDAAQAGRTIVISVTDRGPGIPEAEQARIFEKFYRRRDVPAAVTGSGMGLAIAREIVKAHNGEIWVESRPGEGSRFSVSVPAAQEIG